MSRLLMGAICLVVAGWAAADTDPKDEAAVEAAKKAAATEKAASAPEALTNVRQIEITKTFEQEPVCHMEAPTGSRISVRRCYVREDPNSAAATLVRDLNRQELDQMRQRQLYEEQARRAREAALRRGPTAP